MSPLWLVPVIVLVVAAPFVMQALRAVARETAALHHEAALIRGQLRPAVIRLRNDSERLARHQLLRTR
jgi:hypothetical protein